MTNILIVFIAQCLFFILPVLAIVLFFWLPRPKRWQYAVALAVGGITAFCLAKLAGHFFFDPRPFVDGHVAALFPHTPDNGFPSDHTTFATTFAFVSLFYARKWRLVMLPIAVAIGAARVFAHVHSWIDIIGGIAVGLIASGIAVTVTVYIIKQLSARHSKGEVHA